jgi:hypothetical protein
MWVMCPAKHWSQVGRTLTQFVGSGFMSQLRDKLSSITFCGFPHFLLADARIIPHINLWPPHWLLCNLMLCRQSYQTLSLNNHRNTCVSKVLCSFGNLKTILHAVWCFHTDFGHVQWCLEL